MSVVPVRPVSGPFGSGFSSRFDSVDASGLCWGAAALEGECSAPSWDSSGVEDGISF